MQNKITKIAHELLQLSDDDEKNVFKIREFNNLAKHACDIIVEKNNTIIKQKVLLAELMKKLEEKDR